MKKRLTVLALAFAMVLTMSASVFAENGQNAPNPNNVHDTAAADAYLVKYAQIPEGVDLAKEAMANKTFTFTFKATDPLTPATTNNYGVPKADFEAKDFSVTTDKLSVSNKWASAGDTGTQNKVWKKSISEIFSDVDGNGTDFVFPRAGEYTFKVKETAGAATDKWTYSSDEYTLRLIVKNDLTTSDPDDKVITDVTIQDEAGTKVDPSDDDPTDNPDDPATTDVTEPAPSNSNGGFTFTNTYKPTVTEHKEPSQDPDGEGPKTPKNPDPDPSNPNEPTPIDKEHLTPADGAFELDKYVLGEYGDQTKPFEFTVKVELPDNYKDFTLPSGWTDNDEKTVSLKHNEKHVFDELPVGTKITVNEGDYTTQHYAGFTTSSKTTTPDNAAGVADAQAKNAITVLITEDGGYVITRNSFDDTSITPTGIIINNLPYVLLIGIALGGIVLFTRKRRYE